MSFELFESKVLAYCKRAGLSAHISHEDGRHIAKLSDGGIILANTVNQSVTVTDIYHNHCVQYSAL